MENEKLKSEITSLLDQMSSETLELLLQLLRQIKK